MQAKVRYCALLAVLLLLCLAYLVCRGARAPRHRKARRSYLGGQGALATPSRPPNTTAACTMATCFDFSLCEGRDFLVYVYPVEEAVPPSTSYMKVLEAVRASPWHTPDPALACLFVLGLDTLDRDPLSQDFVRNLPSRLERLPTWRGGANHLIFNLYSGTWPDYAEDLSFSIGRAILAKASMAVENYRPGFDISLPLFHRHHPARGGAPGTATSNLFPVTTRHFLAFKGKRYVHGIGSDARNSLHHLHNGRDVVMVTTCKHGKNWREMMDERCEEDNAEYDRWDYEELLSNSTFCLVPRGRRLGSFRFLETLQAGCLPVILSNGWQLPLAELVDWTRAAVVIDERQLLQVTEVLHGLSKPQIHSMRQQTQVLWDRYLSSVEKIVWTTLEIVRARVAPHTSSPLHHWNSHPGALLLPSSPSPATTFTAIISTSPNLTLTSSSPIFRLIRAVSESSSVASIVVVWSSVVRPPPLQDWVRLGRLAPGTPLTIAPPSTSSISPRFHAASEAPTEAVLCLEEDVSLTTSEVDFALEVWRDFQDRLVGFPARGHWWDETRRRWRFDSRWTNEYSVVLTTAAFLHRRLAALFLTALPPALAAPRPACEHLLINFLAAHLTRLPPVKVTQRRVVRAGGREEWRGVQACMAQFVEGFGYMPLVRSQVRLDPVLFKDPVSNTRKKYRRMELVQ